MAMTSPPTLDPAVLVEDFPLLADARREGRSLVYLDSAASSQKPRAVIEAMSSFYETSYANVHRGVYELGAVATEAYEGARRRVADFVGAAGPEEIVFTKNVTEAINLVARTWGHANLGAGDVVVLSEIEHHANIVPWLMLAEARGIELRWIPMAPDFTLDLSGLDDLVAGASLVAVTAMSNVLGTLVPVDEIVAAAHAAGARCLVDAAQWTPHLHTDVAAWGADFVGITGHKLLGPSGIGVLWARRELLEDMPAFLGGGEMIRDVRKDGWTPNDVPWKFEAGTPPIVEAVGLAAAIDYLDAVGMEAVRAHEVALTDYALGTLADRLGDRLRVFGPTDLNQRGGVISFELADVHPHDVSQVLDQHGVCVRAGHHCAKPLMRVLGVGATARASLYLYNDRDDVDALATALEAAADFFAI